ncbi:MAG: phosphoribosylglycinamide formyltransferase [bacterium]|nr:phosphoribosylglycinamide formyltransferase [bacterium]MDD5353749.1 phosphoribosylglycinamide formyltransferase [bacterium]
MKKTPLKIGVLVSGSGSNLQAIIDAVRRHKVKAEISIVISNKADAYALTRAGKYKIPTLYIDPKNYPDREAYTRTLTDELKQRGVGLVCLAGFMSILTPYFVKNFPLQAMNIHPALLPSFGGTGMYGHHVHEAVLRSGAKYSGCTVHFVDEGCDTGPIIVQEVVPVKDDDTADSLAKRILKIEHKLYPLAIKYFADGKLHIVGKRVWLNNK